MYYPRFIDSYLAEWASRETHKPLLLRGARQVGKSTAVRHLAERFESLRLSRPRGLRSRSPRTDLSPLCNIADGLCAESL